MPDTVHIAAPIICPEQQVENAWIDYNGHMNMAFYNVAFDRGVDHFFDLLGIGAAYAASGQGSCFVLEAHVTYLQELKLGDPLRIELQVIAHDHKRIHFFENMFHATDGYLAATSEQMTLHVDLRTRRSAPFPEAVQTSLGRLMATHSKLERPPQLGHVINVPIRPTP